MVFVQIQRKKLKEIQTQVELPIIGIVKRDYEDSEIYITPTMKEVDESYGSKAGDYSDGCNEFYKTGKEDVR